MKSQGRTIGELNDDLDEANETIKGLKLTISNMNEQIVEMEETIYEQNQTQLELVNQLEALEHDNQLAEDKIKDLMKEIEKLQKNQGIYICHRQSRVDQALGDFINTYPEKHKMQIM